MQVDQAAAVHRRTSVRDAREAAVGGHLHQPLALVDAVILALGIAAHDSPLAGSAEVVLNRADADIGYAVCFRHWLPQASTLNSCFAWTRWYRSSAVMCPVASRKATDRRAQLSTRLAGSSRTWRAVMPSLAQRHTVLAPDLLGHGESPEGSGSALFGQVGAVTELLDQLRLDRPVIVGHSYGGFVATVVATTRPVRGVVNVDQPFDMTAFGASDSYYAESAVFTLLRRLKSGADRKNPNCRI